jgi:uncharacterized protein
MPMNLTKTFATLLLGTLLVPLAACRSSGGADPARAERQAHAMPAAPAVTGEADYVLALLRSGPSGADLSPEERVQLMQGHLANINRLAQEGDLLVAGPFGMPNPDPTLRGIFVFRGGDVAHVRELCASDPTVKASVLVPELFPMRAPAAMLRLHDLDMEAEAAQPADAPPTFNMRVYGFYLAPQADQAARALAAPIADGRVLLLGRLGGERKGQALLLLDAPDADAARALLEPILQGGDAGPVFPWYGSASLARLPELAKGG